MPDTSMKVYRTQGPGQNPTDIANMVELFVHDGAHVKGVVDYKGYQNCPGFIENNDKAVCTACFDLGQTTQEGIYGLAWVWTFNELEVRLMPPLTSTMYICMCGILKALDR
jgi:hypothetical protein